MVETVVILVIANSALTFGLTGLIWTVQSVHYPIFGFVGRKNFARAHDLHVKGISPVVAPMMVAELITSVVLAVFPPAGVRPVIFYTGLSLVALIWLSTFLVQVPLHDRLRLGSDPTVLKRLVRTNWIRTAAWSLKSALSVAALYLLMAGEL